MNQTADEVNTHLVRERLSEVAKILNDLRDLGIPVSVRYGAILTDHGFILPSGDGEWEVRMKICDPEFQPRGDADDD